LKFNEPVQGEMLLAAQAAGSTALWTPKAKHRRMGTAGLGNRTMLVQKFLRDDPNKSSGMQGTRSSSPA